MKRILLMGLLMSCPLLFYAQSAFRQLNGGNETDQGNSIISTSDGGLCIIGSTNSFGNGSDDVYVIKLGKNFEQKWAKVYDLGNKEYGFNAIETSDGGIAITGQTFYSFTTDSAWDAFVLKLDAKGHVQWSKSLGGVKKDVGNSITELSDGTLLIAGSTTSYGQGLNDIYLAKLSSTGFVLWTRTMGTVSDDIAYSVTKTKDGGFAFAGASNGFRPFVVKCDPGGSTVWSKNISFSSSSIGAFNSVIETKDCSIALAGYTKNAQGNYDVMVTKLDKNGEMTWTRLVGNKGDDKGNSIIEDKNKNLMIAGYVNYARTGYLQNLYSIKLSNEGNLVWTKAITEGSESVGRSLIRWRDSSYIITGSAWENHGGSLYKADVYLAKFDPSGFICGSPASEDNSEFISPVVSIPIYMNSLGGEAAVKSVTVYQGTLFQGVCSQPRTSTAKSTSESAPDTVLKDFSASVVPNLVTNNILNIQLQHTSNELVQASVLNMNGKVMHTEKISLSTTRQTKYINISGLASGTYYLVIAGDKIKKTLPFVKE